MAEGSTAELEAFLTARQVAAWLGVSAHTVLDWSERGRIPSYKINGARRFLPSEVRAWLAQQRQAA